MNLLPKGTIRFQLMTLAVVSGCAALLLACCGFLINETRILFDSELRELRSHAELVAANCSAPLDRQDRSTVAQMLAGLERQLSLDAAAIYTADGEQLAEFVRLGEPPCQLRLAPGHVESRIGSDRIECVHEIRVGDRRLGALYLRANLNGLQQRLSDYRWITLGVMFASLLVSMALAFVLQRGISQPVLELAKTAKQITSDGDYSIRVTPPNQGDELGQLYSAFNQMLDRVAESDRAIKLAHDELEKRVEERTAQLQLEMTHREKIQQDLIQARDAAEAANRAKSEFLANMSHEIRTPLNAILGFADLLRRGADISLEDRKEYLETIHKSGEHLLALISDILDLSKIEAGQLTVEQIPCSPYQIIAETVSLMRVRAQEKGLQLEYEWRGPIPETITSDPARLRQLLLNIIGNAIKFTDQGRVQAQAQLIQANDSPLLVVDVIDTGIGIPRDKLQTIFDPFCQADTSVTRRFGGTGLGLAICRRIAKALGGGITVQSNLREGSVFSLAVETGSLEGVALHDAPAAEAIKRLVAESGPHTDHSLAGSRILIADDGDTNRRLMQILLKRAGAETISAENGQEALDAVRCFDIDLILLDMQMPVMDGYTAISKLRADGVQIPTIALTAHAMKGDAEKCLAAGCTSYLTKPVDPDALIAAIARLLEMRAQKTRDTALLSAANPGSGPIRSTLPLDDQDFRDIVSEFVERLQVKHAALHTAANSGDLKEFHSLVHWLKGSGGTAGFHSLTVAATEIEDELRLKKHADLTSLLAKLDALLPRIESPRDAAIGAR